MAKPDPVKVMFVVYPTQRDALQRRALELRAKRGGGRVDASEVLRAVLDDWLDAGGKLPARIPRDGEG